MEKGPPRFRRTATLTAGRDQTLLEDLRMSWRSGLSAHPHSRASGQKNLLLARHGRAPSPSTRLPKIKLTASRKPSTRRKRAGDAVDLTVIVAELGQLLLNSGNRRHRRSDRRISRPVIGVVGRIRLVIVVIVPETQWVTPPIRASIPISATGVRATIPTASVPVMAVATAMPAGVTSDKVAMPAEMAAVESPTMEPSPVKPSATMASAAVGECTWSDRQHSGKDQSDNLNSAHYPNPFYPHCRAAPPGTIIGSADSISAELMAIGA
jgi:hypothetical protein